MLIIDKNLYSNEHVKKLVDHLNEKLVTEVVLNRVSFLKKGIASVNLMFRVTNYYNDSVEYFNVPDLHPHNARVLEENIQDWLNKEPEEQADEFIELLYSLLAGQGYSDLEFNYSNEDDVEPGEEIEYVFEGYTDYEMEIKLAIKGNECKLYDRYVSDKHFVYHTTLYIRDEA